MRILHFIPSLGGGGAERQLAYFAGEHAARGHEVHVASVTGGVNEEFIRGSNVVLHRLNARGNYDPRLLLEAFRVVRRVRPDVIQTWLHQMDVVGGFAARTAGVPWVLAEMSSELSYPPQPKFRLRARVSRLADALVSNSVAGDDYWRPRLPATTPRHVISNGIPLDEIAATAPWAGDPPLPGVSPEDDIVLYVGRLAPEKNIENLVPALAAVTSKRDVRAVLCGAGPEQPRVDAAIAAHAGPGAIVHAGYRRDVWALMKRARVLVTISTYEGQPNTALEAMACGCPIVASDIPPHREFLGEDSALLVDRNDPDAVAAAIARVLDRPEEAARRVESARKRVEPLSVSAAAARYEEVYRSLVRAD